MIRRQGDSLQADGREPTVLYRRFGTAYHAYSGAPKGWAKK